MQPVTNTFLKNVFPIVHLSSESVRCCGQQTLRHLIPPLLTALSWILDFEFLRIFVVAILDVCCGPSSNLSFMAISVSGRGEFWRQGFPLTSRWSAARMGWVGSLSCQLGLRNPNLKVCPYLPKQNWISASEVHIFLKISANLLMYFLHGKSFAWGYYIIHW